MKAALVVNDKAGSLTSLEQPRAALMTALAASGFALGDAGSEGASLEEQWAAIEASDAEVVFVAGGDGTLRDAAARLIGGPRALAPLPGGTMNRFCHRLGLPDDPVAAAEAYRPGPMMAFDVATANGEVFLYQSIVGAPTRLMRFREMQRGNGARGWWPLFCAVLRELARPSSSGLIIRTGVRERMRGHAAVITMPEPEQPVMLTLDLARQGGSYVRLRQAIGWLRGQLGEDAAVATRRDTHMVVHGARWLRLSLDGEMRLVRGPVRFRIRPGALRVLAPPTPA